MKFKSTFLLLFSFIFLAGNMMVKAQPSEVWNTAHDWNTANQYRGIAYNKLNNHLYVAGSSDAADASLNNIQVLDATTGDLVKTLSLDPLTIAANGYGIKDVEVSSDGGIFAIIPTTNQWNPQKLYYWENEDTDPILLWTDGSGIDIDFGPGFSIYGDFSKEAFCLSDL